MSDENTEAELCDCDVCQQWRDKENLVTGIFTMPNEAYDAAVRQYPVLAGDFNQLTGQPMSTFFGLMVLEGIAKTGKEHVDAEIRKVISEWLEGVLNGILENSETETSDVNS